MERYELVRDIAKGNFGVAKLMRERRSKELVCVKYIARGEKINMNVEREIMNHRCLTHPNVVRFKEVLLTPTHLAIVMEYAAGGELFYRISNAKAGRLGEDEARFFFKQLIAGVSYCHSMHICHRDLKLENILLADGSGSSTSDATAPSPPRLKICDFGFSKSSLLHSRPESSVGTPAYIAPEILSRKEYDGKAADVWSCGVALFAMVVGGYPFEDPRDPSNIASTVRRICIAHYTIPNYVSLSAECRHLFSRIFVRNPAKRITTQEIRNHPWFLMNESSNANVDALAAEDDRVVNHEEGNGGQSTDEIMRIIEEARSIPASEERRVEVDDMYFADDHVIDRGNVDFVCQV